MKTPRYARRLLTLLLVLLELYGISYAVTLWVRHHYDDAVWWTVGAAVLGLLFWRDRKKLGLSVRSRR